MPAEESFTVGKIEYSGWCYHKAFCQPIVLKDHKYFICRGCSVFLKCFFLESIQWQKGQPCLHHKTPGPETDQSAKKLERWQQSKVTQGSFEAKNQINILIFPYFHTSKVRNEKCSILRLQDIIEVFHVSAYICLYYDYCRIYLSWINNNVTAFCPYHSDDAFCALLPEEVKATKRGGWIPVHK